LFNGIAQSDELTRVLVSYVVQGDQALMPSLTVRETLRFAAMMRLPRYMDKEAKLERAGYVIQQLGLEACADTVIGSPGSNIGISDGQRRRVSIGVQILTDPKILVLDEPTLGLDSQAARGVINILHSLAQEGRTIICTLSQSPSDFFPKFGSILLLAKGGKLVYEGGAEKMLTYFEEIGQPCPVHISPR
jgi:ABC-type multidrug transport system ATPase subunit